MTATTDRVALVCPFWCTRHEDMNQPHPKNEAELATYDETTDGYWVHASETVTVGGQDVSVSVGTDWNGCDREPPVVFLNGHDLTLKEAHELAVAILGATLRLTAPGIAERLEAGDHASVRAALDAYEKLQSNS